MQQPKSGHSELRWPEAVPVVAAVVVGLWGITTPSFWWYASMPL
ncbi:hypothetical protein [Acrocarpospora pleiomorpha]